MLRLVRIVCLIVLAASATFAADTPGAFHRGMVISCPRWGPIWGSPAMAESLVELSEIGVDSVAIHPYGWVKRDGTVEFQGRVGKWKLKPTLSR